MDYKRLLEIIAAFKGKKVLVVGDVMLDKSIRGEVSRISPEAPVQVVNVEKEEYMPGGAANVASNIASLGGNAYIIGTVGNDEMAEIVSNELKKRNINADYLVKDETRPTITKMRIIARSQQLLRVDYEKAHEIDAMHEQNILAEICQVIKNIDIVIVSDYGKGLLTKNLVSNLAKIAKQNGKYIIVDPKPNHREHYYGCGLLTPNYDEACKMSMLEEEDCMDVKKVGTALVNKYNSDILITRGENGISLFAKNGSEKHIPTKAKEVYDVTGAGDTLVAALALALCAGASLEEAAMISNHAAGIVVGKIGTAACTVKELQRDIKRDGEYKEINNINNNNNDKKQ